MNEAPPVQHFDVLIVGAGHGGAQAAIALRQQGFAGSLALLGKEPHLPYERPPLSKEYLALQKPFERIVLRTQGFWQERGIALQLDCEVVQVDATQHWVETAQGERIGYSRLIWASGARPRPLAVAGAQLQGVHCIRSRADVDAIMAELHAVQHVVVIGCGFIGLEAAAVLRKLGREVSVVEAQDRVLARVAGVAVSRFYEAEHRAQGVVVHLGLGVDCLLGKQGRVAHVRLSDGRQLAADMVIVGIGVLPDIEPLIAAGAAVSNGVSVDGRCRSSLPDVFAIGDCASHFNRFADGLAIRLESVQNANDQATLVAREILGKGEDYAALPWFWSNQYDLRLQTVGLSTGHDQAVLRGDPLSRAFSVIYLKRGRVIALDCINASADYVQGRGLVLAQACIAPEVLADTSVPLKSLL
jgi:3-phenylpropionate/trans-cinnamate dioxygenase ferredoxin reductase subunit